MSNEKPEALELADIFENLAHPTGTRYRAAAELRRQHARIQELEAMLEAVGAGGVSAQRITQAKDHIEQPIEMVSAPVLPEPDEYQYRMKPNWDDKLPWTSWEACSKESAANLRKRKEIHDWIYEVRERYTEQQVRELLATPNNLPVQAVEKSATHGMNLHQRILHVGGRENAQTYIEFGSVAAVRALVAQVLRDLPDGAHGFAMPAPQPQADALDAESWVSEPDSKPLESDGEVFVRFSDGTIGTGWASYWHGASVDFAQWDHPDPDEDRTVTHWMKPPTIDAAIAAAEAAHKQYAQSQADALDAERYRWLRDPTTDVGLVLDKVVGETPSDEFGCGGYKRYEYRAGEELDDAIDAAIAAAKENK